MVTCSSKSQAMLNTDIIYNIVDQLAANNERDSLQNMARASKLLNRICRVHLFKRVKMDVHDWKGVDFFHSILSRDPQVAQFVRHISITDNFPPTPTWMHPRHKYLEITHDESYLSEILLRLGNLNSVAMLFQYVYACNESPLHWYELSRGVRTLFQRPGFTRIKLEGIRSIPLYVSRTFLSAEDLHLSRCTFTRLRTVVDNDEPTNTFRRAVMKRLSIEWLRMGEKMGIDETPTMLAHWAYIAYEHQAPLPDIEDLYLSLGCWSSIMEANMLLNVFRHSIRSVALNATGLHLEALRLLPFYKAVIDGTIRPLAWLDSRSILLLIAQGATTLADGWVEHDLQPLSIALPCSPHVRSLDLTAAYWDTISTHSQNGEIAWIWRMLEELPEERAGMIDTLCLRIKAGNHFLELGPAALLMKRFGEDEMWRALNDTLSREKWIGLRSLSISVAVPPSVHPSYNDFPVEVLCNIRNGGLRDLDRRGILHVGFQVDI